MDYAECACVNRKFYKFRQASLIAFIWVVLFGSCHWSHNAQRGQEWLSKHLQNRFVWDENGNKLWWSKSNKWLDLSWIMYVHEMCGYISSIAAQTQTLSSFTFGKFKRRSSQSWCQHSQPRVNCCGVGDHNEKYSHVILEIR